MRWLLDQGLPRSAASELRNAGEDALHVGDIGMSAAEDTKILEKAEEDRRVVVTLDADFHSILAMSGAGAPSVIRIREEGLKGPAVARIVLQISAVAGDVLMYGCVVSYSQGVIRLRRLPFKSSGA